MAKGEKTAQTHHMALRFKGLRALNAAFGNGRLHIPTVEEGQSRNP